MEKQTNRTLVWLTMLSCFFLLLFGGGRSYAQSKGVQVSGKVYDTDNEPLSGVAVILKGANTAVLTNADGSFTISVSGENPVLEFSMLGFVSREISVGKRQSLVISLEEDRQMIDEVVVVAYGTQTKATVTGALSTINSENFVKVPVADVTNVLAGKVPGVSTIQTTGQPGADKAQIYIRGAGSLTDAAAVPLVMVDGIERPMSSIDPNEIESISVLKDASSTAVFGVRGANGVILVTTKRGEVGKPTISFNSTVGIQRPMSYLEQANSYETARFWNLKQMNDGITDPSLYFTREAIEAYRTGSDPIMYPDVNWSDVIYKKAFVQTKHNINLSGGTKDVRYFVSVGYYYQDGLLKQMPGLDYDNNYKYGRYNLRANLDFTLSPSTTMKFNVGGIVGKAQEPRCIENVSNAWMLTRVWTNPLSSPGFINGIRTLTPRTMRPGLEARDGYQAFYGYGYNQKHTTSLTLDIDVTQHLDFITSGLSVSAKGGYDINMNLTKVRAASGSQSQTVYYKTHYEDKTIPVTDPDYDKTYVFVPSGEKQPLTYSESSGRDRNWYMELRANYNRKFNGKHAVGALLLYNQSKDYYPSSYSYLPRGYVGFVGRVTYGYMDKYLVDFNAGYNGSENFAPGKTRYGFFPSGSFGWVISKEKFMRNQTVIDFLKLRASVGLVGNDLGTSSRFMYMDSVWNSGGNYSLGIDNQTGRPYYTMGVPGNRNVTWEKSLKYNVGLELNIFKERLSFTGDVFYEDRTDILMAPKSTPGIIATRLPNLNIGHVTNRGYEISLGWNDRLPSSFMYDIEGNMSFARNKIINMDEVFSPYGYQHQTGGSTGRSGGLYKFERLYQDSDFHYDEKGVRRLNPDLPQPNTVVYPGDAMYADLNGDGVVDGDDTMVAGYAKRPEYLFGLNATVGYKGFFATMNWTGATHTNKMLSIEYRIPFTNAGGRGLIDYFYKDCWTLENKEGTLPRAAETTENWNSANSTLWLRDASYIRLKTLTLGYTFSKNGFFKKVGINSLSLNLTGYNLLTISPMKFEDPETNSDNSGQYPLVKTYNLGLSVTF